MPRWLEEADGGEEELLVRRPGLRAELLKNYRELAQRVSDPRVLMHPDREPTVEERAALRETRYDDLIAALEAGDEVVLGGYSLRGVLADLGRELGSAFYQGNYRVDGDDSVYWCADPAAVSKRPRAIRGATT